MAASDKPTNRPWAWYNVACLVVGVARGVARLLALAALKAVWWRLVQPPSWTVAGVTPAVLTASLRRRGLLPTDAAVVSISRKPLRSDLATGNVAHPETLTISYSNPEKAAATGAPLTAIVKCTGLDGTSSMLNSLWYLAQKEYVAYTALAAKLPPGIQPAVYHCEYEAVLGVVCVVMEDLSSMRQVNSRAGGGTRDISAAAVAMAELHVATWNDRSALDLFRRDDIDRAADTFLGRLSNKILHSPEWQLGPTTKTTLEHLQILANFNNLSFQMTGYRFHESTEGTIPAAGCGVVCHGDVRLDNVFFDKATGAAKVVDWQLMRPHHPAMDLAWLLLDVPSSAIGDGATVPAIVTAYETAIGPEKSAQAKLSVTLPMAVRLITAFMAFGASLAVIDKELVQMYWDRLEGLMGATPFDFKALMTMP